MPSFATRLLAWFERHGRRDLPWQREPNAYRVWVSEIMLQQTQVQTVMPYYERFMARFPALAELAAAELDEVLGLWSGLGYYARARNLHRAARCVVESGRDELPAVFDELVALPGIGRSTAGAILALSRGQRWPILDGNVKRVLARHRGVAGWPGAAAVAKRLWAEADEATPAERVAEYTQAIMDLGATVCTKRKPQCGRCPVNADCRARLHGLQESLPAPRPKRERAKRRVVALVVVNPGREVLLERRAEQGVWGGLYSFPELADGDAAASWCWRRLGCAPARIVEREIIAHAFTHFDLELSPIELELDRTPSAVLDGGSWLWYNAASAGKVGVAAPVAAFLLRHFGEDERQIA